MSAQSAKKKRIGSRRRVAHQNKTSEPDEFHITDSASVAQRSIPEENTESLNVLANPDNSQSETQNPPSPELTENRRKLGSSRRNKREVHVKGSATESYSKPTEEDESYFNPTEEVEEQTRSNETPRTTQMSLAIQSQRQEEVNQGHEHCIMSVRHDSSLYSTITPEYSSEVQHAIAINCPEADLQSLIPKSENLQGNQDKNDTDNNEMDRSDTLQSEELKENACLVGISELTSISVLSCPTVDQQLIDQSNYREMPEEEPLNMYSVTEKESNERDKDTELLKQDANLQDKCLVTESHLKSKDIESSVTPEISTEKHNPREHTEPQCSVEQVIVSSPNEELPKDEGQNETVNSFDVKGAHHSDEASHTVHEQEVKPTQIHEMHHSSESVTHDATEYAEVLSGNLIDQAYISDTYQSESIVKSTDDSATKQEDSESYHEHKEEVVESAGGNEALQTTPVLVAIGRTGQEESSQRSEHDVIMPVTPDSSLYSVVMPDYSPEAQSPTTTNDPEADLEDLIAKSENLQEDRDDREADFKVEVSNKSVGATLEGMDKSDTLQSQEVRGAHHSEDAGDKVHEQEVNPTQMHEIDDSSESVTHDATEHSEIISGNLIDQADISDTYQSESVVKSTDDSATKQEDSNPDDKQDECPTRENKFEALENINEDHHVYETKTPEINDTERVDFALGQVHESEGTVDEGLKPSTEQTVHQELFSETDESKSSLQTLQSEIHAHLDSQPQQNDTDFHPIGNRRKLGSSRRNKGRQHAKDSDAESYHRHTEEAVGNTNDHEPFEITKMPFMIEKAALEKSMETMLEGMDTFDIAQTEEVRNQVKDNQRVGTIVGISELPASSLPSTLTVNQQPINQSNCTDMPEEDLPKVYSGRERESKDGDEDTELLRQDGNLQDNYLVSESHLKSKDIESSITPEKSTEKHNPREHTEPQCSVEQVIVSSPNEELPKDEKQNEIFNSSDVKGAYHSEDAVHSIHDQEHEMDHSSESVTHDAIEYAEVIPGNLIDQADISDTYQSESIVKSTDDSATKQEDSNPDYKQDECPTRENNLEALEHSNEDIHVYDIKISQIDDTERVDTALSQVYEGESHVEDDMKPKAEQTVHQEKDEESDFSLHTLQSQTNAHSDSQPQESNTGFNLIGNRRKLGSSRRNKGRHHAKDSVAESYHEHKEEVVESAEGNEALQTTPVLGAIGRTGQEESSQRSEHDVIMSATPDSSLYSVIMPDYSPEAQSPTTTNDPEADLKDLIAKSENLQEDRDDRDADFKVEVSNESVGATLEGMDKSDTLQSKEVRGAHHSEDAGDKVHEQEVNPTQMHEIDDSSESVTHDATEHSEIISGNLIDQADISDTYQSESIVKSTDDSATKQEDSNPDYKQDECPTRENNLEALEHSNEDIHVYDIKISQIDDTERVDTALSQVYEGESHVEDDMKPKAEQTVHQEKDEESDFSLHTLQSQTNAHSDSQPQESNTGFNLIGNRRKLGSSRRNKGRHHAKDSVAESYHEHKEEVVESAEGNEALQTTPVLGAIGRTGQEESSQRSEHDVIMSATPDSSLYSVIMPDYSPEAQNPTTTNDPEADLEDLIAKSENLQEDRDDREADFKVEVSNKSVGATLEGMDKSDTLQSQEVRGAHHSEDAGDKVHEQEVNPTQMHEIDDSSESVTHDATEHSEIISGNLIDQADISDTYQSESIVKSTDDSATKQEDSNPDDKQDECPTKENKFETLENMNEDHHVYETKTPEINDTERVDFALGQVHESEGTVGEGLKPSTEQTVHQELFSESDESKSSLQTLQSEIHAHLDSQPQQNDTDFHPIGNRRKLGSSRRNKGRQHAKDSDAESYHRRTEEAVGNTNDLEPFEITKMPFMIEKAALEKSMETMLEGMDTFDIAQTEEVRNQVKDNQHVGTLVGISELPASSLPSTLTVNQQPINQSNCTDMPEEDLPKVYSGRERESKDGDEDTELLRQDGNLQDNYLVSESHLKSKDIESSIAPEKSTEKHNPREHTEPQCSVEQVIVSSPNEELPKDEKQNEIFNSSDVKGAHHSEDAVHSIHDQEHEMDHSSESVTHDTTEYAEVIPGNLIDQADISDTYQSESIVKSTDDSATKQEDSNPDYKQDECPTRENNLEALEHSNEDIHVYDIKISQIDDTERVDTALSRVYEGESHVEDDMKPKAEQTVHQEKDEESDFSLHTLQSQRNAHSDSQPQESNTGFNLIGNRRKLGSSRRNKGRHHAKDSVAESYREHKEEVVESAEGNEALQTTPVLGAIGRTGQEESSQRSEHDVIMSATPDSSLYSVIMPDYSPEAQSPTTTNDPEADLEDLIAKSENLQEYHDDRDADFKVEVSNKSVGATLEGMDKSDTLQSQEVRGAHHSEDAGDKVHEQEVNPTQMHEIDDSSESVTHDATEHSEIISGNLIDQADISDTYQSESIVKSTDDSATKQEDSNPDYKQDECPTRENNLEALEHSNEDIHVYDIKISQIDDTERVDTTLSQVYEGESHVEDDMKPKAEQTVHQEKDEESDFSLHTLQSQMNAHSDSQPQESNTGFNLIGNRRKLGSSRRNKGRHHAKDSVAESYHEHKEEVVESAEGNEALQTTPVLGAIGRTGQEESSQRSEHDVIMPATPDSSLYSVVMPDYSPEAQSPTTTNDPEADLEDLIAKSENLQEDRDDREADFKVEVSNKSVGATLEGMDKSDTLQSQEVRGAHHSEDAGDKVHEQEVNPTQMHEIDDSSESVTHDATEHSEIISGNLIDQADISDTYQSESVVKSTDDSATKQEDSNPDDKQDECPTRENKFEALENINEDHHVYETKTPEINDTERVDFALGQVHESEGTVDEGLKPSTEQTVHQELFSETDESKSSLQTLQSEIHAHLDSQPQQNDTDFHPIGNRRKLGSSRRNKGRQHAKDSDAESYHRHTEEAVGNTNDHEPFEITKMPFMIEKAALEKSMETMLEGMDTFDIAQTEEVRNQVKDNQSVGTIVGISEFPASSLPSTLTVNQQPIDQSNSTDMPEEDLPKVYSGRERESKDGDEDAELLRRDGNLQDNYLVSESHVKSEDMESSVMLEISTEKHSSGEHTDIECSVEQAAFSSSDEMLLSNEIQKENENLAKVRGCLHSEVVLKEMHKEAVKPTQMQEMPQIELSSIMESESSLQSLQSETNALLDSQPQDNSVRIEEQTHTGFNPTGHRRKLGSSRRNKGKQHVKDPAPQTHNKPKKEFEENTRGDQALQTAKMPLATETIRQEEFKKQTNLDLEPAQEIKKTVYANENTETMAEENKISSQNVMDNSTIMTTDITSSSEKDDSVKSNKDVNEEENLITEPENLSQFTGYDTVKMDLKQSLEDDSDIQSISYYRHSVSTEAITACQVLKTEALSYDKDSLEQEMTLKQTIKDYFKKAESSMDVQVFEQGEVGEKHEDPAKKDHETEDMNASQEVSQAELTAVDVSEESGISIAVGACNSQQGTQEKTHVDNSENLQRTSNQKRRKMGSTRRPQLKRKPEEGTDSKYETKESDFNVEDEERNFDKMEVVGKLPMSVTEEVSQNENAKSSVSPVNKEQQETNQTSTVHNKGQRLQSSTSDLQSEQSSMISNINDLTALLPEQSASHHGKTDNPVKCVQVSDTGDSERNITVDATNTGFTGGSFVSVCETTQSTQNNEEMPEGVNVMQDRALKSAETPVVAVADLEIIKSAVRGGAEGEHKDAQASTQDLNDVNEGAHDKNLEMKDASPNLNLANRRRKLGSTRRNLGSRNKGEDLHQKQEVDKEATEAAANVADVKSESFLCIKEKEELQVHIEDKDSDSEQRKEKVFEAVERSHTGESHFKPPAQQTVEVNPVSHGQLVETEHQLTPGHFPTIPPTSSKHDGGEGERRRRKLGSHRKSRGHQSSDDQTARGGGIIDTQNRRVVRSVIDESATGTTEEAPVGLDKISEVDESDKRPSSSISTSEAGEHSMPASETTPVRATPVRPDAEIHLVQDSPKTFSLDSSRGEALTSNRYNVLMVGDSSVGKTSFMKRAQSGKFSLDLPASVGLDSCMWTVLVDGKPVVLQLWDTAGQERFHSITRQIFHKAQAFLLMYDITSSQSFSAVSYWANCIQEGAAENVTILLLGNKSDCAQRAVKPQEGEILAKEYNFEFMECSAATGENVIRSLETVARMLIQKADTREETTVLHKEPQQKKSSGCC
ncbi:uncharacterized protein rab44 isoform X2 [Chaetodon auriga]|uniref:uncharacterized protein rab44 isoform X2 n=1 Tax=Chaetodon auriga TaxID=39042 RepID=UPI004032FF2D